MVDRVDHRLRSGKRSCRQASHAFWPGARLWLALAVLAWLALNGLQAQDGPGQPGSSTPVRPLQAPPLPPPVVQDAPPPLVIPQEEPPPRRLFSNLKELLQFRNRPPQPEMAQAVLREVGLPRFQFKIAPNTPVKDLLPTPPRIKKATPLTAEDLAQVPEVEFQAPPTKDRPSPEALKQTAHQIARINHLNDKQTDGFLEALLETRPDLNGLPLAMGDACRTKGERSKQFTLAVATVRAALPQPVPLLPRPVFLNATPTFHPPTAPSAPVPTPQPVSVIANFAPPAAGERDPADRFWEQYQAACAQEDRGLPRSDRAQQEHVTLARIAALMQVLAPESPSVRVGLVKYLSAVSHVEATRALARLAIFSGEDEVRQAAVDALKVRRERDYTEVLLQGLRYPWPAVARRASDALVKLERADLVPQLVDLLDEPDPRAPVIQEVEKQKVPVVRELVRINHHRNCLLCHAPGNTSGVSPEALTAGMPIPGEPLPSPSEGYQRSSPDVLVRIDVTYLRQDFSVLQPVGDAHPWPEMQRFDFVVRKRALAEEEAAAFREKFARSEPGRPSPYQRAVLTALRELTGRDAEPSPEAWRRLLNLPAERPTIPVP